MPLFFADCTRLRLLPPTVGAPTPTFVCQVAAMGRTQPVDRMAPACQLSDTLSTYRYDVSGRVRPEADTHFSCPAAQALDTNMQTKKLLLWAFLLAFLVVLGLWLRTEMRMDSCLDRGGRWDENREMCEGATE
jgi:hypothetical protein